MNAQLLCESCGGGVQNWHFEAAHELWIINPVEEMRIHNWHFVCTLKIWSVNHPPPADARFTIHMHPDRIHSWHCRMHVREVYLHENHRVATSLREKPKDRCNHALSIMWWSWHQFWQQKIYLRNRNYLK